MARKPQIVLSSLDVDRIEALIAAMPASVFPGKVELQAELDRADVVAPEEIPPNVVTMNSTVKFLIVETGKEFCLTLVYPRDMDGSADKISILAPLVRLGQMSYSVFLIHFAVCLLVNAVVSSLWPTSPGANALGMVAAFALSLVAGQWLYRRVERHTPSLPTLLRWQASLVAAGVLVQLGSNWA